MKLNRIILISLLSFLSIGINAQYFAGGSFNFSARHIKEDNTEPHEVKTLYASLSPSVGLFLSDKLAIGLELNAGFSKNETDYVTNTITKTTSFGLNPFVKYYAVKWNKISLYGKGSIGIDYSKSNTQNTGLETNSRNTDIGLDIYPGLSYDLSDKLQLQMSLNFLRFSCGYNVTKNLETNTKSSDTHFGFHAEANNIATIGDITIGAIYRF
jgi:outer membrane protein